MIQQTGFFRRKEWRAGLSGLAAKEGLITFQPNPHHRRAQLVVLTEKGRQTFDAAIQLYAPQANRLSDGLQIEAIQTAHSIITSLRKRIAGDGNAEETA